MSSERPLMDLTEDQLMDLWDMSYDLERVSSREFSYDPLTYEDVRNVSAAVLLQAAICEKYHLPYPKLTEGCLDVEEPEESEEEDGMWDPLEYAVYPLHRYIDAFATVDGIGDFKEEALVDPVEVAEEMLKNNIGLPDAFISDGELGKPFDMDGCLGDELKMRGYREILRVVDENPDMFGALEICKVTSKDLAKLISKQSENLRIRKFLDVFPMEICRRCYFSIPVDNPYEIVEGEWKGVSYMMDYYDESVTACSLHKNLYVRIGAYIVQELAARIAA